MSLKQSIHIGVLTSLLTLAVVVTFLVGSGTVFAQQSGLKPAEATDPPSPGSGVPGSGNLKSPVELEALGADTVYIHISGSAFTPLYGATNPRYVSGGCTFSNAALVTEAHYNFPLTLPPGSTITSLRFYYNDTSTNNSTLRIRQMNDGNDFIDLAVVSSTGDTGLSFSTESGLSLVLDYVNYSYVLQYSATAVGSTMQLCGARVGYTPPSIFGVALPVVKKDLQP